MVKLERVNKYFFRRRRNEIHVINNTSLEMGEKGLVALLGPSGCGKTTLLNAIGGLDKVNSGRIFVNGEKITRRRKGKIDKIRTLNIGYVFQNYNLIDNMTVFDNVAIALRMVGVKDKKEIEEKVNYVLEKVGMYRYRNRYADMLSGGERQRVGIARAIVKDPQVVIADEPTGNLDSKNTLEVMNIIKTIAEEKLVILVTHEEKLANFYASRIIRIRDGEVVSDEINDHENELDYRIESKIYLKDIADHKRVNAGNYKVDFYNDSDSPVDLDIVIRNGNVYIQTKNPNNHIEVVDDNSAVEFVDEHYKTLTKEETMAKAINMEMLAQKSKRKYKSILNPWTLLKRGFKTVSNYGVLKKILLLGFVISAMFITYAVSMGFGVLNITDDKFTTADKDYITVVGKKISVEDYQQYERDKDFQYVLPGNANVNLEMKFEDYIQTLDYSTIVSGCLSDSKRLTEDDLYFGQLPTKKKHIVIDKMVLDNLIKMEETKQVGCGKPSDFVGRKIKVENLGTLTIDGVSDLKTPCIYTDQSLFINLLANMAAGEDEYMEMEEAGDGVSIIDYELKKHSVKLEKGDWPKNDYEVMVSDMNKDDDDYKIGKELKKKVNGHKLKVVGYYSDKMDSDFMLVNNNTIKYNLICSNQNMTVCPNDKKEALANFKEAGINVRDVYTQSRTKYIKEQWSSMKAMLIMAGVILLISFIEIYLMIRASFLSRIKEVGVYRAIGVKKRDIYKMFSGEILAISTLASLPGFALMAFVLYKLSKVSLLSNMFLINPMVLGICVVLIYVLNLLFGLLPVWRTIRKTPAAILARNDVN